MKPIHAHVVLDVPPERAWALLSDWGAPQRWARDVRSARLLTPGPVGVGSEREVRPRWGKPVRERVTAWEPGRLLAYGPVGAFGPFATLRGTMRLAAEAGGAATRVDVAMHGAAKPGIAARLLARDLRPVLAWMLRRGLRDLKAAAEGPRPDLRIASHLEVAAPPEVVWAVVADLDGYARHARTLAHVRVVSGDAACPAVGLVRACEDVEGRTWTERLETWAPGRSYAFAVDTNAPGYPFPFEALRGEFGVEPGPAGRGSRMFVRFDITFEGAWRRFLLRSFVARWAQKEARLVLRSWAGALPGASPPRRGTSAAASSARTAALPES